MRVIEIDNIPIDTFTYKIVSSRDDCNYDGSRKISEKQLPILKGKVEISTKDIDALIIASDLQGNIDNGENSSLLGEQIAEYLKLLIELEFNILPQNVGIILAGDLYATLDKRGGYGDVRQVYLNFRDNFKWVIGVNGNHDKIGENKVDEQQFKKVDKIYILHKQTKKIGNFTISGISGIIGNSLKPNRVEENEFLTSLKKLLVDKPDFIILHESPDYPDDKFEGNEKIRQIIESSPKNLIICGHRFWKEPLRELRNGSQILNVNERVIILLKQ